MSTTPMSSVIMFLVASFFGALGQYFYKSGADLVKTGAATYWLNPRMFLGACCYLAVMFLFVAAFKRGGSMAVLYPIYATTFIWGALISQFAFGTEIRPANILGMILIGLGMYCMGM